MANVVVVAGEDLRVRSGQHAGALGGDGRDGAVHHRVEVALHRGPGVLPYFTK
jgi:hypothetical protein